MSQEEIAVPKGWELKKISDIGHIITGSTPKTSNSEFYGNDFPFYGPADLGSKIEIFESQKGLTQSGLDVSRVIPEDSILVQCIGDVGKSSIIKKMGACNQQINVIIPNLDTVIPKFVYYWINSSFFRNQMIQNATRTTLPILNKGKFSNLPFFLPQLSIQKQIVTKLDHILGELEVKKKEILELNTTKKLTDFIESNKFSTLQLIQTGFYMGEKWKDCPKIKIGDITKVTSGSTPSRDDQENWHGDIPWIKSGELLDDDITDSVEHISKKGLENSSAKLFPKDTVLIALYGQGKTRGKTGRLLIESSTNQAVCGIFPNSNFLSEYVQFWIRSMYLKLRKTFVGGAQPNWNTSTIKEIEIILPPINDQKNIVKKLKKKLHETSQFQKYIMDIIKQKENNIKYINHIQSSILDSAFSGKLLN